MENMVELKKQQIKEYVLSLGADVCGIGNIDRFQEAPKGFHPTDVYTDCKSVVSFGIALPLGTLEVNPRVIYAHFNGDIICKEIDEIAFKTARWLEKQFPCNAVPVPCDAPNEYWEPENLTAKGILSMKHTAAACGLGQLGKSTLLLNPTYGNRLTVGAVLLNMDLPSDPLCEQICINGCNKCTQVCPVQAIGEMHVNQKLCRPNTYGKSARGFDTVECNRCRVVCPMRNGKK